MTNTAEEILNDLLKHGVRFDMNPTMQILSADGVYSQWIDYLARFDAAWREDVGRAIDALAARSAPVPADAETGFWTCGRCNGDSSQHALLSSTCVWEPVWVSTAAARSAPVGTSDAAAIRALEVYYDDEGQQFDAEGIRRMRAALEAVAAPVGTTAEAAADRLEALEEESFKHRPVLSMHDGSIAGCRCMDRVFIKGSEDYDSHIAEAFAALEAVSVPHPEPEWEYGHQYTDMGGNPEEPRKVSAEKARKHDPDGHRADGSPYWNYTLMRHRKAGPWEVAP